MSRQPAGSSLAKALQNKGQSKAAPPGKRSNVLLLSSLGLLLLKRGEAPAPIADAEEVLHSWVAPKGCILAATGASAPASSQPAAVQRFDFSIPSPDDAVKAAQQGIRRPQPKAAARAAVQPAPTPAAPTSSAAGAAQGEAQLLDMPSSSN